MLELDERCPNARVMLSMKEINFIFGEAENPVVSYGCYRGGKAVFANLYLAADGFRMLISPVEMEDGTITSSRMCAVV